MSVCLSVQSYMAKTTRLNFVKFSIHDTLVLLWRNAICYVVPVLWMMMCFHMIEHMWCMVRLMGKGCQSAADNQRGAELKCWSCTCFCVASCWLTSLGRKPCCTQWSLAVEANSVLYWRWSLLSLIVVYYLFLGTMWVSIVNLTQMWTVIRCSEVSG